MPDGQINRKLDTLSTWIAVGLVFIMVFTVTMTAVMLWFATIIGGHGAELRQVAVETHTALCALKTDIQVRVDETEKLLADNPGDLFGIPRDVIESGQQDRLQTLHALSVLSCKGDDSQ